MPACSIQILEYNHFATRSCFIMCDLNQLYD